MPSKYVVREFVKDGYYHVYNRGVEQRDIFLDEQDYNMFLYYLFIYLMPLEEILEKYPKHPLRLYNKNLSNEVDLLTFCLMPNHFHLLLKQKTEDGVQKLLKQVTNGYTLYFNQKYDRVGGLMQGRYKAVSIKTDEILLHISRYIHLNPLVTDITNALEDYQWSSYPAFITPIKTVCNTKMVLSFFRSPSEYVAFVNDQADYAKSLERIKHLILEE